jgi:3-phosphoshikimate 1-carboxyvinyltransferase
MKLSFRAPRGLGGELTPPPDKSITHRALMLAALSDGPCLIHNPLGTGDCLSTRSCLEALGVPISEELRKGRGAAGTQPQLRVRGVGLRGLREPEDVLNAGNSGTTTRLLAGMLAGLPLCAVITGDASLRRRPMLRVVEPLRRMGAKIAGRLSGEQPPLVFLPGPGSLSGLDYALPVASAQVKSALMLAALRADSQVRLSGATGSRDHTERLYRFLGLSLPEEEGALVCLPASRVPAFELAVPGDPSSAAFFVAAALISGRELTVRACGLNPTRLGFFRVLRRMGALIEMGEERTEGGEPVGTLRVRPGTLVATEIGEAEIPFLLDEVPLLAVVGAKAEGLTRVSGAAELRHKESDRLQAVARLLEAAGGRIELAPDGFSVEGPQQLRGGEMEAGGDHRIAMAAAVLAAGSSEGMAVGGVEAAGVSFPEFVSAFRRLGGTVG